MEYALPLYVPVVFTLTAITTFVFLIVALKQAEGKWGKLTLRIGFLIAIWCIVQLYLSFRGFYFNFELPPNFVLAIIPPMAAIVVLFFGKAQTFLDRLPLKTLLWMNIVRIPVELVLYWLFLHQVMPEEVTFSGRNFDIITGITTPLIALFFLPITKKSYPILLIWNLITIAMLISVVVHAILSAPTVFQQFGESLVGFGVIRVPYILLPALIVPAAFFTHFLVFRRLFAFRREGNES
jgi:hypothetical protein